MKNYNVAFTMREYISPTYYEKRDGLATDWWDWSLEMKLFPIPLPTLNKDQSENINFDKIDLLIITGGNDSVKSNTHSSDYSERRNIWEFEMIRCAIKNNTPILGVCRGMHIINLYFGGKVCKNLFRTIGTKEHAGKDHNIIIEDGFINNFNQKKINVNSYHNQGVLLNDLSNDLIMVAKSEDISNNYELVEMLKHKSLPIYGVQWHPERANPRINIDKKILNSLLKNHA